MKRKYIIQTLTRQIMLALIVVFLVIVMVLVKLEYSRLIDNIENENDNFSNNMITQLEVVAKGITNTAYVISADLLLKDLYQNYFDGDGKQQKMYYEQIAIRLNELAYTNNDIHKAAIISEDSSQIFTSQQGFNLKENVDWEWFNRFADSNALRSFGRPFLYTSCEGIEYVYGTYSSSMHFQNGKNYYIIIVFNLSSVIKDKMPTPVLTEFCFFLDNGAEIFYPMDRYSDSLPPLEKRTEGIHNHKTYGIYSIVKSNTTAWQVMSITTKSKITGSLMRNVLHVLSASLVISVAVLCLIPILLRKKLMPLRKLSYQIGELKIDDLEEIPLLDTGDELEIFVEQFNTLIRRIKEYLITEKKSFIEKQQLEYDLILAQIDPHFIYNTMHTINYLALKDRSKDIIEVNNALITILQDRLRIKDYNGFTTIEQEIEMIHQYSIIQQKRYNNNISFDYEITSEVNQLYIPKFILQTIVENAFNHGFVTEGYQDGTIHIKIYQRDKKLHMSVRDNGAGISPKKLVELNSGRFLFFKGKNFGLYSINERLKFYYGKGYRLEFRSDKEGGTETLITLERYSIEQSVNSKGYSDQSDSTYVYSKTDDFTEK